METLRWLAGEVIPAVRLRRSLVLMAAIAGRVARGSSGYFAGD
jgi:hypothetical protein